MAFSEALKLRIRQRARFCCCLCRALGVEVHHIIPQEDGGPNTEDNAAPLCPNCHETYGANPQKRKFIREVRDFWYDLCDKQSRPVDTARVEALERLVERTATKRDLELAVQSIGALVQGLGAAVTSGSTGQADLARMAGSIINTPLLFRDGVRGCPRCHLLQVSADPASVGSTCPNCGSPW